MDDSNSAPEGGWLGGNWGLMRGRVMDGPSRRPVRHGVYEMGNKRRPSDRKAAAEARFKVKEMHGVDGNREAKERSSRSPTYGHAPQVAYWDITKYMFNSLISIL